jgi:hypothetical protein
VDVLAAGSCSRCFCAEGSLNELNMAVIACRCDKTNQLFGMSFKETSPGKWYAYWAFPLTETSAREEGYDRTRLDGKFSVDAKYPGCPYCGDKGYYRCHKCGHLACWGAAAGQVDCPWCGAVANVAAGTIESLKANQDL